MSDFFFHIFYSWNKIVGFFNHGYLNKKIVTHQCFWLVPILVEINSSFFWNKTCDIYNSASGMLTSMREAINEIPLAVFFFSETPIYFSFNQLDARKGTFTASSFDKSHLFHTIFQFLITSSWNIPHSLCSFPGIWLDERRRKQEGHWQKGYLIISVYGFSLFWTC